MTGYSVRSGCDLDSPGVASIGNPTGLRRLACFDLRTNLEREGRLAQLVGVLQFHHMAANHVYDEVLKGAHPSSPLPPETFSSGPACMPQNDGGG
jgi:hypothetical protein